MMITETPVPDIRKAFEEFTQKRTDVGIVVINQHVNIYKFLENHHKRKLIVEYIFFR